ncbi:muscarinic acetylcholine receptor M2 [Hydra vulgaris]|uniref:Muscarinic acetylcholine receptor M2 n=1 Tax=Hydra vulgaris TaxID=6087 RepID=A0ABM4CDN4_HYDVU
MSFYNISIPYGCCDKNSGLFQHNSSYVKGVLILSGVGLLSLITIFGNLLIILAYYNNRKVRKLANIPIVSLAVTDMFIGLYPMNINVLESALGNWPLGHVMCNISLTLDYVSVQTSINHILLINFDRYLSIKFPMKHRLQQKTSKTIFRIFAVWFFSFLIWIPYINSYFYVYRDNFEHKNCYKNFSGQNTSTFKTIFLIITSVLGYFMPLGIVLVIYFKMYHIIRSQLKESTQNRCTFPSQETSRIMEGSNVACCSISSPNPIGISCYIVPSTNSIKLTHEDQKKQLDLIIKQKRLLRHKKSLRMIASIILAFVVTMLPLNAQWFLNGVCKKCYDESLFTIFNFMTYPNSTINPFLYAFVSRTFRLQFKRILFRKKRLREAEQQARSNSDYVRPTEQKIKDFDVSESS